MLHTSTYNKIENSHKAIFKIIMNDNDDFNKYQRSNEPILLDQLFEVGDVIDLNYIYTTHSLNFYFPDKIFRIFERRFSFKPINEDDLTNLIYTVTYLLKVEPKLH